MRTLFSIELVRLWSNTRSKKSKLRKPAYFGLYVRCGWTFLRQSHWYAHSTGQYYQSATIVRNWARKNMKKSGRFSRPLKSHVLMVDSPTKSVGGVKTGCNVIEYEHVQCKDAWITYIYPEFGFIFVFGPFYSFRSVDEGVRFNSQVSHQDLERSWQYMNEATWPRTASQSNFCHRSIGMNFLTSARTIWTLYSFLWMEMVIKSWKYDTMAPVNIVGPIS